MWRGGRQCRLFAVVLTAKVEREVLSAPGSITPHTKFNGGIYLHERGGGRIHLSYRPQFYLYNGCTGEALPEGTEMVMPGDNISMDVELIAPIAMDEGLRFAIREGGALVVLGSVITRITVSSGPGRA